MLKTFRFRIYPTTPQQSALARAFGSCRFVYNKALEYRKNLYDSEKKNVSYNTLANILLKDLKSQHDFLLEPPAQSLQQSLRHLDTAFSGFFRRIKRKETPGYPRFKSKLSRQSISLPQGVFVDFKSNKIILPKIGKILAVLHRKFEGKIKTCTVSCEPSSKYFCSILVDDSKS